MYLSSPTKGHIGLHSACTKGHALYHSELQAVINMLTS